MGSGAFLTVWAEYVFFLINQIVQMVEYDGWAQLDVGLHFSGHLFMIKSFDEVQICNCSSDDAISDNSLNNSNTHDFSHQTTKIGS